jgi:hypothetical protein
VTADRPLNSRGATSASSGPVSWPEVIAKLGPVYENGLSFFDDLEQRIADARAPQYAAGVLGGFDVTVTALTVLRGCAATKGVFARVEPLLPRILDELGGRIDRSRAVPATYALSCLSVMRCCGALHLPGIEQTEQRWLADLAARARELTEPERHTLALAACAAMHPTLVATFADVSASPQAFVPEQTFGFDVPGFAAYLAAGIDRAATYQDVEPAWLDFVHRFPYKLDTRMLGWPALLFAARAVYAAIGGLPVGEVAEELHRLVTGV